MILDSPLEGKYQPKNHDGYYRGNISVRTALLQSVNTTAVKTLMNIEILIFHSNISLYYIITDIADINIFIRAVNISCH
jgi:membrane peptidoglycan carboxypeptidase